MKRLLILLGLIVLAAGGIYWWQGRSNGGGTNYRTASVERGTIIASISASGVVQAEEVVDVGAQVAGRILRFGPDPRDSSRAIDYNSQVEDGTVLAIIDDALYSSDVKQAQATVKQAEGQLAQAQAMVESSVANQARSVADLEQLKSKVFQFEREWARVQRLRSNVGAVSDTEYDLAKANFEIARATLAVGEASIDQTKAAVKDARANVLRTEGVLNGAKAALEKAETNLSYCTIKSPVRGVIIDRRVNVGQTVVSSLNAPSLFLIAKDLKKLQIWASVNEADIGQVRIGQPVRFTVDARPGEDFKGTVAQIRLNANMTQNVVTYTVVISTDNSDGRLLPYQTANAVFEVDRRMDVLMVPNAALRWQPRREQVAPEYQDAMAKLRRRGPDRGTGPEVKQGVVWTQTSDGFVRPISVKTGLNDGSQTEIITDEITEGEEVVIGITQPRSGTDETNPFVPKPLGSGSGGGRRPQQ
jgi:HlyD family secretion protein